MKLALLETGLDTKGWSARDTVDLFSGTVRGDTIVGKYQLRGGPFHYVREAISRPRVLSLTEEVRPSAS